MDYRDVIILDAWNRKVDPPFNLTINNLFLPSFRDQLKQRLRDAAKFVDSDGDGLGDDWEEAVFGGLKGKPEEDSDGDGESVFLEYALGNNPFDGQIAGPRIEPVVVDGSDRVTVTFRRRFGTAGGLTYVLQRRQADGQWLDVSSDFELLETENPFDGTGTEIVTYRSLEGAPVSGLLRILVKAED